MTKRHALTFEERLGVLDFLKTVCKKDGDYAVYEHGYSDVVVAKILGVKETNVQSIRMSQFGKTRDFKLIADGKSEPKKQAKLVDQVADLTRRLEYLERELGVTFEGNR